MSSRPSTRLLFSGKKCFWKSNISIDVLLIHHSPAQIIEVIAYNADLKREAPHLYVNEAVLILSLDSCIVAPGSQSCAHVVDRAKVDYIFDRIVVSSIPPESKNFEVEIMASTNLCSNGDGFVITKPVELVAYTSPFVQCIRSTNEYIPLSMKIPISPSRTTSCNQESPRGENRGIAESAVWQQILAVTSSSPYEAREQEFAVHRSSLPSPKSITDLQDAAYGAPPSALYNTKVSTTSPNLSNPAGSVGNPRMVPRRHAITVPVLVPLLSVLVPLLPLRLESASAPCTREASPQCKASSCDPEHPGIACSSPVMRALSHTLCSLGLLRRKSSNMTESSSDDEGDHVGLPLDPWPLDLHSASAGADLDKFIGAHTYTPPVSARSVADSESSRRSSGAVKKTHQRRHTYHLDKCPEVQHPAVRSLDNVASTTVPSSSPRTKLLRMRNALDSLRVGCWMGAAAGGSSRISPLVSIYALDQHQLDASPYPQ